MPAFVDLSGKRFGKWTAVSRFSCNRGHILWLCKCDCGNTKSVSASNLKSGKSQSCGCIRKKQLELRNHKHGDAPRSGTFRLYSVWQSMKNRCYNINEPAYERYGMRGISVCDEWRNDYMAFKRWAISNGYDASAQRGGCTIDRINNEGPYCPDNCKFSTFLEQNNNRRRRRTKSEVEQAKHKWLVLKAGQELEQKARSWDCETTGSDENTKPT